MIKKEERYMKPSWAVKQVVRANGLVEDICKHSIGHPNEMWLRENDPHGDLCLAIHACDGCCSKSIRKIRHLE